MSEMDVHPLAIGASRDFSQSGKNAVFYSFAENAATQQEGVHVQSLACQVVDDHAHQAVIAKAIADCHGQYLKRGILLQLRDFRLAAAARREIKLIGPFLELRYSTHFIRSH